MSIGIYTRIKRHCVRVDLTGQRFGRLLVLSRDEDVSFRKKNSYFLVRCDCGKKSIVFIGNLQSGTTKSCGCLRQDNMRKIGSRTGENSSFYLHGLDGARQQFVKAIHARSKGCQYDSRSKCEGRLEAHHLDGDTYNNNLENGILLCAKHHKLVTNNGNVWRP